MKPARWHVLKTDASVFEHLWVGLKTAEHRRFDRDFQVGDLLVLAEIDGGERWTGRLVEGIITHLLTGYGVADGFVVISFIRQGARAYGLDSVHAALVELGTD